MVVNTLGRGATDSTKDRGPSYCMIDVINTSASTVETGQRENRGRGTT
jgi:hypothetical protein